MKGIFIVAALTAAGSANAGLVTVDFEDTLPTYFGLSTYQEDGFTVTSDVPDGTLIDVNNVVRGNLGVFSGGTDSQSLFWGENGSVSTISLANDSGLAFSLLSLDASSFTNLAGQLTVIGTLQGGGTVQQILSLNSTLSTYSLIGMTGLSGVDISFDGAASFAPFDLDNIQMNVVPIPAAVWLFGSALVGIMGWSRRRAVLS